MFGFNAFSRFLQVVVSDFFYFSSLFRLGFNYSCMPYLLFTFSQSFILCLRFKSRPWPQDLVLGYITERQTHVWTRRRGELHHHDDDHRGVISSRPLCDTDQSQRGWALSGPVIRQQHMPTELTVSNKSSACFDVFIIRWCDRCDLIFADDYS